MFVATALMIQLALPLSPVQDQAVRARMEQCLDLATDDPAAGAGEAIKWHGEGGGFLARQCLGMAYSNQGKWAAAASAFDDAAREAETVQDSHSANYWAQAGNAWLAAGDATKARSALDAALASGGLLGLALGEAHLDRARVRVASDDMDGARGDLDLAITHAAEDPLAWLLSATLARRTGDMRRARADIDAALERAPDDASVQLEAGNVAALERDESKARSAWARAIELSPGSSQANAARAALAQFGATEN